MTIDRQTTVGQIAARHPLTTRVFHRYEIDFCCGGGRPLADVCEERGLDTEEVRREIEEILADEGSGGTDWNQAPLEELIDHIVAAFHRPLDQELPRIEGMARKVLAVHGEKDPERLSALLETFMGLKAELQSHMLKEEQVLFPMIRRGQGAMAGAPISVMEHEHDSAGDALRRLRELTGDYTVPAEACMTWRALWSALEALESAMHEHIHLENNILFPRALASAG